MLRKMCLLMLLTTIIYANEKTALLLVRNASGEEKLNNKMEILQPIMISAFSQAGIRVLDRKLILDAFKEKVEKSILEDDEQHNKKEMIEKLNKTTTNFLNKAQSNDSSQKMQETSALAFAKLLQTDFFITVDLTKIGNNSIHTSIKGLEGTIIENYIDITYNIFYCRDNASIGGERIQGIYKYRQNASVFNDNNNDYFNKSLENAAQKITDKLKPLVEKMNKREKVNYDGVKFKVWSKNKQGDDIDAYVYINGSLVGITNEIINAAEGFSFVEIKRDYCKTWSGNINIIPDLVLNIDLDFTDEGYQKIIDRKIAELEIDRKIAQHRVEIKKQDVKVLEEESKLTKKEIKKSFYEGIKSFFSFDW